MIQILELFGGIGSPRCALRNIGIPVRGGMDVQPFAAVIPRLYEMPEK